MHKVNKLRIFIENKDMTEDAGIRHTKIREGIIHFLKTMTIKSIKKDLRVLEIGAGDLKICKQILGNKVKTMDLTGDHDILGDVCNYKFEPESWDIIFILEVLEHIPESQKAIDNIQKALIKNGMVIASSPFTFRSHNPTDYWRFTADGFKYLFKNFQECSVYSTYLNEQERAEHLPLSMFVLAKN